MKSIAVDKLQKISKFLLLTYSDEHADKLSRDVCAELRPRSFPTCQSVSSSGSIFDISLDFNNDGAVVRVASIDSFI